MKTRTVVIVLVVAFMLVGAAFLFGALIALISPSSGGGRSFFAGNNGVGIVEIEGPIYESEETVKQIEEYRKDDSIKAIILRINSPGGSVAASQEIYHASKKAAEEKPVIASMATVAASGGYYVALGATKVLANPGTITGSIGVRMEHVVLSDLLNWAKIRHETLKSGKYKDIGSFDRPLTKEERELLQELLTDIHQQFKEAVMEERDLELAELDAVADGRVFTGREALELGLVDALGGWTEAVDLAAELGGIKGEPRLVEKKKFKYENLFGGVMSSLIETFNQAIETEQYMKRLGVARH